jgi:hypothetical protein
LPVPDAPLEIISQSAFDDALHEQSPRAVTATLPVPPAAGTAWLDGAIAKPHAAAGCVTVNVTPAIVSVPVRTAPALAAAA